MTKCTSPGCHGQIDDGFCGVCGLAPVHVQPPQGSAPPTTGPPGPTPQGGGGRPSGPQGAFGAPRQGSWPQPGAPGPPPGSGPQHAFGAPHPGSGPRAASGPGPRVPPSGRWQGSGPHSPPVGIRPDDGPDQWLSSTPSSEDAVSGDPVHSHPISENIKLSGRSGLASISGTVGTSVTGSGSVRSGRRGSSRGMLGMGMVLVPPVPYRDPAEAVMQNPVVAEKNRFCGNCGEKVGRTRGEQQGRTEGFCRKCGTQFSFTPKLSRGDRVGGQYEVLGCIAHGGLGWIYLARDRNVNDRWVVLKGLLNAGDAEAHKAAAAERAFLSEVEHPNIVKIINFSQHPDPRTGIPGGHIVMEYVGGKSLRELLVERREDDPEAVLPVAQVIAYGLEVLRALGYLHSRGLLYCDFKPDNVIQSEEQIKLIDLGGVRRMDDTVSPVYTTPGYRVTEDELRGPGPTVSADLYSVGRALAVLSFRFSFMREHPHSIPRRETVPVLQRFESFDRLLRRSTHSELELRFHDAGDMADQLTGVLREVLSELEGSPHPALSTLFGGENLTSGNDAGRHSSDRILVPPTPTAAAALLPAPLIDPGDPASQHLRGFQALPPEELVAALRAMPAPTPETLLMLARALITLGRHGEAMDVLQAFSEAIPGDWRTMWYLAVAELSTGRFREARDHFDELYDHLPGEIAPKLGLAIACERTGELDTAASQYQTIWNTDHSYVSAAFGLARIRLAQGDRDAAIAVLDRVPEMSSLHVHAQTSLIAVLAAPHRGRGVADFLQAGQRLERLGLDSESADRLAARVLEAALEWLRGGGGAPGGERLLDGPFTEEGVRTNLERRYRALAHRATAAPERYELIDKANSLRPVTLL
ncbi:tetratricopeptide repeat protein [Nocardiopsis sp. CT-R113]|uniref:non-specific serine/threonine protein kinase n=1 Tax=Nocardiopsis codii TaxID=3065942 RepID=A0ABU7KCJ4_9ACTN|nr:tetratricopeptide repeat protein [Nocardiopsis sp. CT-R113]MEE2039644.1 tetratricopeptide repeat protein [Nocardiopsis sp. CT-R113]